MQSYKKCIIIKLKRGGFSERDLRSLFRSRRYQQVTYKPNVIQKLLSSLGQLVSKENFT